MEVNDLRFQNFQSLRVGLIVRSLWLKYEPSKCIVLLDYGAQWQKLFMVKVLSMSVTVITLPSKLKRVSFDGSFFIDLKRIGLFWNSYYLESYEQNKVWLQWMCDKFFQFLSCVFLFSIGWKVENFLFLAITSLLFDP